MQWCLSYVSSPRTRLDTGLSPTVGCRSRRDCMLERGNSPVISSWLPGLPTARLQFSARKFDSSTISSDFLRNKSIGRMKAVIIKERGKAALVDIEEQSMRLDYIKIRTVAVAINQSMDSTKTIRVVCANTLQQIFIILVALV
jgi:hypothetical protein